MGTITVNVDDETEAAFRKAVKEKYGTGKGKLGKAVAEAMREWSEDMKQKEARKRLRNILEKGIEGFSTKGMKMRRVDMYEDRDRKVIHD